MVVCAPQLTKGKTSSYNMKQHIVWKTLHSSAFKCAVLFTYCGLVYGPNDDCNYTGTPILPVHSGKLSQKKNKLHFLCLPDFWPMNRVTAPLWLLLIHVGSLEILPEWNHTDPNATKQQLIHWKQMNCRCENALRQIIELWPCATTTSLLICDCTKCARSASVTIAF